MPLHVSPKTDHGHQFIQTISRCLNLSAHGLGGFRSLLRIVYITLCDLTDAGGVTDLRDTTGLLLAVQGNLSRRLASARDLR